MYSALFVGLAFTVAVCAAVRGMWSPCGLSMLTSLNPVSEAGRGHRFGCTAGWFVLGGATGGAVLGAGAAGVAALVALLPLSSVAVWGLAGGAAIVGAASDLRLGGFRLPAIPRQVDETWLGKYRRWLYAAGFGVQIGFGFATYVMTGAVYLTVVLAALTGNPLIAFLVGLTFGVVRGLLVLLALGAPSAEGLRGLLRRLEELAPVSLRCAAALQVAAAAVAVAVAAQSPAPVVLAAVVIAAGIGFAVARPQLIRP